MYTGEKAQGCMGSTHHSGSTWGTMPRLARRLLADMKEEARLPPSSAKPDSAVAVEAVESDGAMALPRMKRGMPPGEGGGMAALDAPQPGAGVEW